MKTGKEILSGFDTLTLTEIMALRWTMNYSLSLSLSLSLYWFPFFIKVICVLCYFEIYLIFFFNLCFLALFCVQRSCFLSSICSFALLYVDSQSLSKYKMLKLLLHFFLSFSGWHFQGCSHHYDQLHWPNPRSGFWSWLLKYWWRTWDRLLSFWCHPSYT